MTHPQSTHRLPSFDRDTLLADLNSWPLSPKNLEGSLGYHSILCRIRECGMSMIIQENTHPENEYMKDFHTMEGLMTQLIALGEVQYSIIRNYSRLMEVIIRGMLCHESLSVQQREYTSRLKLLTYLD